MLLNNDNDKFIDLKEISKIILAKDVRAARKWCKNHNIEVQLINKKQVAYRFLVDMELDKKLIEQLQRKHPFKWGKLYNCYKENDKLEYLQLLSGKTQKTDIEFVSPPPRRIPKSSFAKNLLNS